MILDIETAPHKAYIWDCRTEYVSPDHIVEPGYTLCWAAKWLGEESVMFGSIHRHGKNMIRSVHRLLDRADAVVHFNGKKFDVPTLNREFLLAELAPPSPFKQIDLLQTCRRKFKFASNRLDYVSRVLGIGAKVEHKGMELWKECMAGLPEAWTTMESYNKGDVKLTEAVYTRLLPWIDGHPNVQLYSGEKGHLCPTCGGATQARGYSRSKTLVYRRHQCKKCGGWSRKRVNAKEYAKPELVAA